MNPSGTSLPVSEFTLRLYRLPDPSGQRNIYSLQTISEIAEPISEKYKAAARTYPEDPNKRAKAWWDSLSEDEKSSLTLEYPLGSVNTQVDVGQVIAEGNFIQVLRPPASKR